MAALLVLMTVTTTRPASASDIPVPAGANLQEALNAAAPGDTILLEPGATYVGSFIIRQGITLRTAGPLPEGRVMPAWSGQLAILVSPTSQPALRTAPGVSGARIIGIEIAPSGHPDGTLLEIGSLTATAAAQQPQNILIDRVLARGHVVTGQTRGFSLHGSHITVVRSHVSDIKRIGMDTQALWINNGWGPYTIVDNYLEAAGENILVGGVDPRIDQLVPADIVIAGNLLEKPLFWKGQGWMVKTLLALENARRVTIRGNVLTGNWASGQTGHAVLFTPRNRSGKAPWAVVEDVLMEHNIVRDSGGGISLLGDDDARPSARTRRIDIRHNLLLLDHRAHGGQGRCLNVGRAPQQVSYVHNTCIATGSAPFYTYRGGTVREVQEGVFRANVFLHQAYGFFGENAAPGLSTLQEHYPGGVLAGNLIGGGAKQAYPGNDVLSVAEFEAQFRDYAGGNYRLSEAALLRFGGTMPGADLDQLHAVIEEAGSLPINRPPVAYDQAVVTPEDVARSIVLTGTDPDGDPITFAILSLPKQGTLSGTPPGVIYTPAPDYHGPDSFTFAVQDDRDGAAAGKVTIVVTPVNDAPVAYPQTVTTTQGVVMRFTLAGTDVDGDPLTFLFPATLASGALTRVLGPTVEYVPRLSFFGTDSFVYTVTDGLRAASATVTLHVTPRPEISVPGGANLQEALNAAMPGDTILLEPGATYLGSFIIRQGITLRTAGPLPEGRVTPVWSGQLAILRSPTSQPALRTAPGVSGARIIGIEIAPNDHPDGTSLEIGSPTTSLAFQQPRDILIDRVLARGHVLTGQKRGFSLHGSHITVARSHVSEIKRIGMDTQALWISNGWGPYTILDNYLEASGENILVGGEDPRIDQLVPADILIAGNQFEKPLFWKGQGWMVKTLLALENARRVTIRGNVLTGNWASGQTGHAVLFTPRNQSGKAPWAVVEDVLMEHNIVRDSGGGISLLGDDDARPSARARRIDIRHNLLLLDHRTHGGQGRCLNVGRAPQQVSYVHNTCIATGSAPFYTYRGGTVREVQEGVFRANVFLHQAYGFFGENAAPGLSTLQEHYPGGVLAGNLIGGGAKQAYPGNDVLSVAEFEAQFRDYPGGDYRLSEAALLRFGGTMPGADLDQLQAVIVGAASAPTPVNRPPVAHDQAVVTVENMARSFVLTGTDPDDDPITFAVLSVPQHGFLSGKPPALTYVPAPDYHGPDSFTFAVRDHRGGAASATVTLHVTPRSEISVPAGANLQDALNAAQPGDTILLEPGATYVGNFVIRRGITLRTGGPLPEGRVTPDWSGRLAILRSPNHVTPLRTAAGVSGARIVGIEIAPTGHPDGTAMEVGSATANLDAQQPQHIVIDRVLARGHAVAGQKRGLALHGSHITVIRSHISDMKRAGMDTQAIWINNGWGPYTIVDNYLEASGENIMIGGDDPRIDQLVPADILIAGNLLRKPLSWKGQGWNVKNLLELKNARRVVIRGNVLEGNWVSGQTGYAVQLTPRNQYGKAPWSVVEDILIEHNIVRDSGSGINLLGDDDERSSQRSRRIDIRHNLLLLDHRAHGGPGRCLMVGRAPQQVSYTSNTCIATGSAPFYTYKGGEVREIEDGIFRANVFLHHAYGFFGQDSSAGLPTLEAHYPGGVLAGNLIGGGAKKAYPGNHVLSVAEFEAQFRDYAGGDYRLTEAALLQFGAGAPGADIERIHMAIAESAAAPGPGE